MHLPLEQNWKTTRPVLRGSALAVRPATDRCAVRVISELPSSGWPTLRKIRAALVGEGKADGHRTP